MIDRGAEGTSDDFTTAEEYLLRVSGRVNVNRATSKDMVTVLGITTRMLTPSPTIGRPTASSRTSTRCARFRESISKN